MDKRQQLYRSGELEVIVFYAPNLPERKARLSQQQLEVLDYGRFIEVMSSEEDSITLRCLPEMVVDLQRRFCYVTNYIPRRALTGLGGFNAEDIVCRLPDGTGADLAAAQRWLNESVAAGWRVGISRRGMTGIVVTRENANLSAQLKATPKSK